LREDLEAMGPVRISDVDKAQIKIAMIAKRLSEEGKIAISGASETFV
jgi:flagellar motor switch protein FliG